MLIIITIIALCVLSISALFALTFLWFTRCAPSEPTSHLHLQVVAHRGESCAAPENTLRAITLAHERGARAVEFDVGMTKDRQLVLLHDLSVDRTTDGKGLLRELTLAQARALKIYDKHRPELGFERIPTLEEALSLVAALGLHADIEIKQDSELRVILSALDDLLPRFNLEQRVWISSFYPQKLYGLRRSRPKLITALNVEPNPTKSRTLNKILHSTWLARYLGIGIIKPHKSMVTPAYMRRWHTNHAIPVLTWTVNTIYEKEKLVAMGAHLITDCTCGGCAPRNHN